MKYDIPLEPKQPKRDNTKKPKRDNMEKPKKSSFLRKGLFFMFLAAIVIIGIIAFVSISNKEESIDLPTTSAFSLNTTEATTEATTTSYETIEPRTLPTTETTPPTIETTKATIKDGYYYDSNGEKIIGLQSVDGKLIGTEADGSVKEGKHKDDKGYYYTDKDGVIIMGWNGKTYTGATGYLVTGLQEIDNNSYFFNEEGDVQTGWVEHDKKKYYADEKGAFVKGWKEIDGQNYFFEPALATGWQELDGHFYYFDTEGNVIKDKKIKINGTEYSFDTNGWSDRAPEK